MASPFPIPNNGLEIVWNHTLRYRGYKLQRQFTAIPVNQSGDYYQITVHDDAILRWSDPQKRNAEELDNISIYYLLQTKAPARSAGFVVLVQESLNMAVEARRAWTYSPGTRACAARRLLPMTIPAPIVTASPHRTVLAALTAPPIGLIGRCARAQRKIHRL